MPRPPLALVGDGSTSAFASGPAGDIGELAAQCLGGLLATLPAATAFCLPNANSYARLVPDALAPVRCDWAAENRAVALRTIAARTASPGSSTGSPAPT